MKEKATKTKLHKIKLFLILPLIAILPIFLNTKCYGENMTQKYSYIEMIDGINHYKLSNGLKVLIKEDHSVPLATFSIWYKVGSRNEVDGIRGIAHFLEHMMFKGTKKLKKGEISETIVNCGGTFNAFTFFDGTGYFETVPVQCLEKMLELESDRMKNSRIDSEEVTLERTVVLSELKGGLNSPTRFLDMKLREIAFKDSPYKHPIIGYEEDLNKITDKEIRAFYNKYYTPENSTIVLVGDVNKQDAIETISQYFSDIPNSDFSKDSIPKESLHTEEKRISVTRPGTTKYLELAYHIPGIQDQDIYPLSVLEEVLISGKKSKLNKALVDKGLATEVSGGSEGYADPSLFYILVSLTPKAEHKKVEEIINKEIKNLIKSMPTEEEVQGAKNRIKADFLHNLDGSYNQAIQLGYFDTIRDWKTALNWVKQIDVVSQADVIKVLKKYFNDTNKITAYFVPELKEGETYQTGGIDVGGVQHYQEINSFEMQNIGIKNNSNKYFSKTFKLKDGSNIIVYDDFDLPLTYINAFIAGGTSLLNKKYDNTAELTERLLIKGSQKFNNNNVEEILDITGSEVGFSIDDEMFKFTASSLNENINQTIDLLIDLIMNPRFDNQEFKKEQKMILAEINELKDDTGHIADRNLSQLIYDKNHPLYMGSFEEDIKAIKSIKRKDLFSVHEKLIKNNPMTIVIVTGLKGHSLISLIKSLEQKLTESSKEITVKSTQKINIPHTDLKDPSIRVETLSHKTQTDVLLSHITEVNRNHPDFYKLTVANQIIGGHALSSRLSKKVRDENGLVYSIGTYFNPTYSQGEFGISFGTPGENVDKTIELVKNELDNFVQNGITEEELTRTKKTLIDSFTSRYLSTRSKIAQTLNVILFFNLGENYINDYPRIINNITVAEVNEVIKRYIHPEKLNTSICGNYKQK